jgi:DNA-binding XRE family transcriptional regulator
MHKDKRTPEEIEMLVVHALTTTGKSASTAGKEIGVSRQVIEKIREGISHVKVRPDLRRWRSCLQCEHFPDGLCTFGFPDPEEDGVWVAATHCNTFSKKTTTTRRARYVI